MRRERGWLIGCLLCDNYYEVLELRCYFGRVHMNGLTLRNNTKTYCCLPEIVFRMTYYRRRICQLLVGKILKYMVRR
jgi:hypothetical protein